MLDSSAEAYKPLLQDAMGDRPNVEIIPRDGLVWSQLKEVFTSHIDPYHPQVARSQAGTINQPERNDMLLVTANLTTFPKRSIFSFDSLATMVLYQLLSSIRTSTLFQRYGCVRMLLWANDENKRPLLPRSVLQRKRVGFEAEISCDWIHEVAGYDFVDPATARLYLRDEWLNLESTAATLRRMEQAGIPIIPGRETELLSTVLADPDLRNGIGKLAGHRPPDIRRPFKAELEELQARGPELHDEQDIKRLSALKFRETYDTGDSQFYLQLLQLKESAMAMDPASPEFRQLDEAFDNHMENLKKNRRQDFGVIRDNYHHFRHNHPSPTLLWDRRATEPLTVDPATELYPNTPACLLDIQPKPMNPLFRQYGPGTSRTGDISDVLLRLAFSNLNWPIEDRAMDTFWPGFKDMSGDCPSLRDATRGGSPLTGRGALTLRAMNETHWAELMQAWLDWPFRPSYEAMLGRLTEDVSYGDDGDSVAGGGGVGVMP
jgi:transcription factor 1